MNELLEILNEIDDTIDYETETGLIDDHLLDSFAIISLVSIDAAEMTPENFNSATNLWKMVERLQEDA